MSTFATGKFALALCDRCGQQYDFHQLREEWNRLMTCPECFEVKHPQLNPPYHAGDAQALPWARPARQEPMTVLQPSKQIRQLLVSSFVGNVTVVIS